MATSKAQLQTRRRARLSPEPVDQEPSAYVRVRVERLCLSATQQVLDLGSGRGRHARWLAAAGHSVIAADLDPRALSDWPSRSATAGAVLQVVVDAAGPLPFRAAAFDLVLVVHLAPNGLIANVTPHLRRGGHLVVETFGGHGENWRALPGPGRYRAELEPDFDVIDYTERPVGPTRREAASVRFLARRR